MNKIQDPINEQPSYESNQPSTRQWILIAAIGLIALIGVITFVGGGYFTATRLLTERNSRLTATAAAATAIVVAEEQAIRSAAKWPLLLLEPFNNNDNEWIDEDIDDEYAEISVTINGVYKWVSRAKQGFVWWVWPTSDPVGDFYLAVEAQNQSDLRDAQYGLIFHFNEETEGYNYFEVRDSQYFSVWNYDLNGWTELIPFTLSSAIKPGKNNFLEVIAQDDAYYFLINNEVVAETSIDSPAVGYVGVAIGLSNEGEESTIVFDNFELRTP